MTYKKWFTAFAAFTLLTLASSLAMALEKLPATPPVPADNPNTRAKVELGKKLFFEPRLSSTGTVSCNSCHNVMSNGTDSRATSMGVDGKVGGRSAPTVFNAAYLTVQFWDGRAPSLEEQAKGPILNPIEMGMKSPEQVVSLLKSIPGYAAEFKRVFGGADPVTYDNLAKAIAAYERSLTTPDSAFDRYKKGKTKAMSAEAVRGMKKVEELGCTTCHTGPNFAGPAMDMGQGFFQKFPVFDNPYIKKYKLDQDLGRYNVTKEAGDKNVWRVPTWRNVALTAPYFHNGSVATLDEAVRVMAKSQLNKELDDKSVQEIVAFLNTLTGQFLEQKMPQLPQTPGKSVIGQ